VKHGVIPIITENNVIQALEDDNKVFRSLNGTVVSRSFPFGDRVTTEAANTLIKVLEDGYVLFDESVNGIRCCYENGWVHRALVRQRFGKWHSVGILLSRLHEKYFPLECRLYYSILICFRYIEYLIGETPIEFPDKQFPAIQSLCMGILKHFSKQNLQHCIQDKLSTAGKPRPLEAQYQDEFYRAFNTIVGRGVPISSEWSRKSDGRVDFWIPQKRWGIKLLRDHNRVDEHCSRFKEGGRYYPWIEAGMLED
jgi:hypothetical protein